MDSSSLEAFVDELSNIARSGDVYRALSMARRYADDDPLRHHLGSAAVFAIAGQNEPCMEHAQAAYAMAPDRSVVLQQYAVAYMLVGDQENAERHARTALTSDDSVRSRRGLAHILLRRGKLDESQAMFQAILDLQPKNVQARNGLGLVHLRRGDQASALEHFATGYVSAPADPTSLRNVINMYVEAGWAIGAVALSRITRSGHHSDAVKVALDMMNVMISQQIAPDFPGKNLITETEETIGGLLESSANLSRTVQLHIARMLFDAGHVSAVRTIVARLAELSAEPSAKSSMGRGERGDWLYLSGLLSERDGDNDAALERYSGALDADPRRWDACCNALTILLERDDDGAMAQAAALLAKVPPELKMFRHQLLFNEALYLRRIGKREEATRHCQIIVEMTGGRGQIGALAKQTLSEMRADQPN